MFFKAFVYAFTFIFVGAFKLIWLIISGTIALITNGAQSAQQRKQAKIEADRIFEVNYEKQELVEMRTEEKINSLQNQMETEFQLADAYRAKAAREGDGVKRAELRRKAMQADARADALLDKIYKLQGK